MSIKKTLGGDRLGAGKKMTVELHNYGRSTHDLSYLFRTTMSAGTLVPFMSEIALPGDTFDIDINADIKTHPTVGPLFGSYKMQADTFLCPIRLYNSLLHNNTLGIGMNMNQVKLPQIRLTTPEWTTEPEDFNNSQINPSSLLAYFGIRGIGNVQDGSAQEREFNATMILAYWEIYKNYYANKQEEIGAVLHTPAVAIIKTIDSINSNDPIPESPTVGNVITSQGIEIVINFTGTQPKPEQIIFNTAEHGDITGNQISNNWVLVSAGVLKGHIAFTGITDIINWRYIDNTDINTGMPAVKTFALSEIDDMRTEILKFSNRSANFVLNDDAPAIEPYVWLYEQNNGINNVLSSQEGLGLKTYQSDLLNNWLSTEWIDGANGISEITAVSTVGDKFTIDSINLAEKVYKMLNRIAVSGGTSDDWIEAVYGVQKYGRAESPMYMGGLSKELVFEEVVSNSSSADQPLGTLAGRGRMSGKHKGGSMTIKVDEPSYIIGIVSLTPRIDYSQGNKWDINLKTIDDLHKPALDEIGFQELTTEQAAWWDTTWDGTKWVTKSAGKQPAWINYQTNINRTFGNFAIENNEMFMTLNRKYEKNGASIKDMTTYIDPAKYNNIFAETSLDAQNFWTQLAVNITARRKMSAKVMPNL